MITGDHKDTALAVARELGIASKEEECITGEKLDQMSQEELNKTVTDLSGFCQSFS